MAILCHIALYYTRPEFISKIFKIVERQIK